MNISIIDAEKIILQYVSLSVWKRSDHFNLRLRRKRKGDIRYVLLLPRTERFDVQEDVQKILNIRDKPHLYIVELFLKLGVAIEYFTTFSQIDKLKLGPVATDVPEKICLQKYKKLYFPDRDTIAFVGSKFLANKFPEDIRFISVEQFVAEILFPSKSSI